MRPKIRAWDMGAPFPSLPRDRQTDRQERLGTERTVRDGLGTNSKKAERTAQAFSPGPSPPPSLSSGSLPKTHTNKFKTCKGRTGDKVQYRSQKRRGRGLRSPCRTLKPIPTYPSALSPWPPQAQLCRLLPSSLNADLPKAQQGQWFHSVTHTRGGRHCWGLPESYSWS